MARMKAKKETSAANARKKAPMSIQDQLKAFTFNRRKGMKKAKKIPKKVIKLSPQEQMMKEIREAQEKRKLKRVSRERIAAEKAARAQKQEAGSVQGIMNGLRDKMGMMNSDEEEEDEDEWVSGTSSVSLW